MFLTIIFFPLLFIIFLLVWNQMLSFYSAYYRLNKNEILFPVRNNQFYFFLIYLFFLNITTYYLCYNYLKTGHVWQIECYTWMHSGLLKISIGFLFDGLTYVMLFIVVTISSLVIIYSFGYMFQETDNNLTRFLIYILLFTFFMLILVTADNFIQLFLGWEGVGLCSYLLINFWYTRIQANKSAIKALIVNRIGDFGLILAMSIIFFTFKTLDYSQVFSLTPYFVNKSIIFLNKEISIISLIAFFLLFGAIGKSAQLGLHMWLPDAMEGPTPVSALIHAATMVTAGVFLIIRTSFIFEYAPSILSFMVLIGSLTSFFGASVALAQYDIKKVIAYSTCSQLGYMIFACGTSNYINSLFHLTNHAFFKALLFLTAGAIIHCLQDEQDMRKYGNLRLLMPLLYTAFLIGSLALMGFPFLAGFYSKDLILETTYYNNSFVFAYWLGVISTLLTSLYSIRVISLTFFNYSNSFKQDLVKFHEPTLCVIVPIIILTIASIFSGYLLQDIFSSWGTIFFGNSIFILPEHFVGFEIEYLPFYIKLLPFFYTFVALFFWFFVLKLPIFSSPIIYYYQMENRKLAELYYKFYFFGLTFLTKKWFIDKLINNKLNKWILKTSYEIYIKSIDKGILESLGPTALMRLAFKTSLKVIYYHTGSISDVIFLSLTGFMFFLIIIEIFI